MSASFPTNPSHPAARAPVAVAWALAALIHALAFPQLSPASPLGLLYLASAALLLWRPASLPCFALFQIVGAALLGRHYETLANHLVLEFWAHFVVLAVLATRLSRRPNAPSCADAIEQIAFPLLRLLYLLLFVFAVVAKLNSAFLSPEASCAAVFLEQSLQHYRLDLLPGLPQLLDSGWPQRGAIALTFLLELAIPLCLCFRRWRPFGIGLALAFHIAMGMVPILGISSFSAAALPFLLLFLGPGQRAELCRALSAWLPANRRPIALLAFAAFAAALWIQRQWLHPNPNLVTVLWILSLLPFLRALIPALRNPKHGHPSSFLIPQPRYALLLLVPVLAIGASPYLGLKTQGAFTMFSNLRLLGSEPNHWIAPPPWRATFTETVEILDSNLPALAERADRQELLTVLEFQRLLRSPPTRDFFVLCRYRDGILLLGRFAGELTPHPLLEPPHPVIAKVIQHRPIPKRSPCPCAW